MIVTTHRQQRSLSRPPTGLLRPVPVRCAYGATRRSLLRGGLVLGGLGVAGVASGCGLVNGSESEAESSDETGPKRIAALYATEADYALALGLPVVASYASNGRDFPPYHADRLEGVTPLQTFPEPDLDALNDVEPDLILMSSPDLYETDVTGILEDLSEVYFMSTAAEPDWRTVLLDLGERFDRVDVAEKYVADYDERVAGLRERMDERWGGASFAYVGPIGSGQFYVAQPTMQTNIVLHDELGLAYSSAVPASLEERRTDISYEELGLLEDADILVVRTNPVEGGTEVNTAETEQLEAAPLWDRLPAVEAGDVYLIPGDYFYASPLTATANLDWAEENLLA